MTGFDLEEQLAAYWAAIPIIFITGHDDAATRERVRRSGAADRLGAHMRDELGIDQAFLWCVLAVISAARRSVAQRCESPSEGRWR